MSVFAATHTVRIQETAPGAAPPVLPWLPTCAPRAGTEAAELGAVHVALPHPMRAFVDRLTMVTSEECPWKAFLPAAFQDPAVRLQLVAKARADAVGPLGEAAAAGRVWQLSRDAAGCRLVQSAFDNATTDREREALASELQGHVWEALQCPHANHVLQKAVGVLRAEAVQFIIDEIALHAGGAVQASRHKYGCRVVQRLIEYCPPGQICDMAEKLMKEMKVIARHPYGNYVVQKLLLHGTQEQRGLILAVVHADVPGFAADANASAVLGAAVELGGEVGQELATSLVEGDVLLVSMSCSRLGHTSIEHILELLEEVSPKHHLEALRQLTAGAETLGASRFGRHILDTLSIAYVASS